MATFILKADAKSKKMDQALVTDFTTYLYGSKPVSRNQGKVIVATEPEGGKVISPPFQNGFIGAIFHAYNEHRHLVLRPDDVWLAITTALGLYVNNHSEEMRHTFVSHEGKIQLTAEGMGSLYSANWPQMINQMSDLIEKHTKGDVRQWLEPSFSTTTSVNKTVGQVVLMGVMKNYFDYKMRTRCGLPKVTLEGTLEDWVELRRKAIHLKNLNTDCLTHWAGLLDPILSQFVDSYSGKVDVDFWSRICHRENWGSGPTYLCGWINVFIPFHNTGGSYILNRSDPSKYHWGKIGMDNIPPSTTEVPVLIDDNGTEYATFFYGGHIVCVHNEEDDTLRPSLDWAMVDVTDFLKRKEAKGKVDEVEDELVHLRKRMRVDTDYNWQQFPKPLKFSYGA